MRSEKCRFVFGFLSPHPERSEPRPAPSEKSLPADGSPASALHTDCPVSAWLRGREELPWDRQKIDQLVFLWDQKKPAPFHSRWPGLEAEFARREGGRREAVLLGEALARALKKQHFAGKCAPWPRPGGKINRGFMNQSLQFSGSAFPHLQNRLGQWAVQQTAVRARENDVGSQLVGLGLEAEAGGQEMGTRSEAGPTVRPAAPTFKSAPLRDQAGCGCTPSRPQAPSPFIANPTLPRS